MKKACKICGCTEEQACRPNGCAWVSHRPPICSACFTFLMNIRDLQKVGAVLGVFGIDVAKAVADVWVRSPPPSSSSSRRG